MTYRVLTHDICQPRGQALIEALVFVASAAALLALSHHLWNQADLARQAPLSAWFDLQQCRAVPSACPAQRQLSGYGPSISTATDRPVRYESRTLLDAPIADTSGTRVLDRISGALWRFSSNTASTTFGLPDAQRLVRVKTELSVPNNGQKSAASVAMVSNDWAASDRGLVLSRVSRGSTPISAMAQLSSAAYFPVTGLLMPGLEAIGLESGSAEFRRSFHGPGALLPFPGTLAPAQR